MKNVACLAFTLIFGAAFTAGTRADQPKDQVPSTSDILALQDPDGTPYVVNHPRESRPTQTQIEAAKKQAQQDAQNKDWLLRSYEEQLKNRAPKQSDGSSDNLYLRLASDKNLSKLAGLPDLSPSLTDTKTALRTGANNSGNNSLSLRPDPTLPANAIPNPSPAPTSIPLLKPLITPLGAADAAGLHNFYGANPPPATTPAPTAKKNDVVRISPDLDMPGQVAAKSDLTKASLTFDALPEETLPSRRAIRADTSADTLPLATNEARLQKLNDTAMVAPGSTKTAIPVNNMTTLKLNLANDPAPPAKLASPSPVRQPISNPYSILDR